MKFFLALIMVCVSLTIVGNMGIKTGLILLSGLILLYIPYRFIAVYRKKNKNKVDGTTDTSKTKTTPKPSNWGKALIGFGLIGLLSFQVFTWSYNETHKPIKLVAKHYVLKWQKMPGDQGGNPSFRSSEEVPPARVDIQENNEHFFKFIVYYMHKNEQKVANFFWDKKTPYGTWSQIEPPSHGTWYLESNPNNPDLFIGGLTDETSANWKLMRLEKE